MNYLSSSEQDGSEFGFTGTYLEIEAGARIVYTQRDDENGAMGELLITTVLEAADSGTRVTTIMRFPTADARKAAMDSGMTGGMEMSYQLLDQLLEEKRTG